MRLRFLRRNIYGSTAVMTTILQPRLVATNPKTEMQSKIIETKILDLQI